MQSGWLNPNIFLTVLKVRMTAGLGFGEGPDCAPAQQERAAALWASASSPNTRLQSSTKASYVEHKHSGRNRNLLLPECAIPTGSAQSENRAQLTTLMLFKYQSRRIQIVNNTAPQIQLPDGYFVSSPTESVVRKPSGQRPRADPGPHFIAAVPASKGTHDPLQPVTVSSTAEDPYIYSRKDTSQDWVAHQL